MVDREVVLRFVAFRLNRDNYKTFDTLDSFLTHITKQIDLDKINDQSLAALEKEFIRSMSNAKNLFGEHAFRKWDKFTDRLNPFNRALFDSWSVLLVDYEWSQLKENKAKIVERTRELLTIGHEFLNAITTSTNMESRIATRFSGVEKILKEFATE